MVVMLFTDWTTKWAAKWVAKAATKAATVTALIATGAIAGIHRQQAVCATAGLADFCAYGTHREFLHHENHIGFVRTAAPLRLQ
ncbi:hypothetical protein KT71_001869 [Congregibacter litoralis KT71]|uniref:Uncharacterized protein n=1 Tax=Congregibacter litoralis KT71 TaxID=314285 RepID=V7HS69_9GAMM|nr:hypothetical protein KT71_001869 [Congregibacter litoralis KT71]